MTTSTIDTVGFIGLGVMGEPMCGHLTAKCARPVLAFDIDAAPLARLAPGGAVAAASVAEVAGRADLILLSLPGGAELEAVAAGADGLLSLCRGGATVVDTGTSPVALTHQLAARFAERGLDYADAPVARGRAAAQQGTLSTMVGASAGVLARIRSFLECYATDVTHCGDVGAGQVVKLMNNMVLFQNVHALAEALAIGRRAGVDGAVLFDCLAKGSGDSFALGDHGMKAMLPGEFPERAFSTDYALKDLSYALALAAETAIEASGAGATERLLEASRAAGHAEEYFPAFIEVVERGAS
ncbi:MAG TPA: NAD(P)-dependent oxidoreductase [Rhodospirillales bacterium]|jgi:hypothetical protein|nr:NAD(P)-dependent oxidoreductase [Rhodospirillales bacterium]